MPQTREQFIEQAMADFESPLIGYAATILNDTDRARDVVQDTFIRLCQQDVEKVRDSLKSWLFTVCRNRALDILRKDKHTQPLEEIRWKKVAGPGLQPDEQADFDERLARRHEAARPPLRQTNAKSSSSNSNKDSAIRKSRKSPASPRATSDSSSTPASNASANSSPTI